MLFSKSIHKFIKSLALNRVLVALSGGPDSQALLLALRKIKENIEIGIAHVNHNWREESKDEAVQLANQAAHLGLPFYLQSLNPKLLKGNIEEECREARYQFFKEICKQENYQAVFLGHHRDDLAETILKRLLEGASLSAVKGMSEITWRDGIPIIRPFLKIQKNQLLQYLQTNNISYFEDKTNSDSRFLRGKMRKIILPNLNREFGKSVNGPLVRVGQECKDLNEWMQSRFSNDLKKANDIDLSKIQSKFEMRWLTRAWLKYQGITPSHRMLEDITDILLHRKGNKHFFINHREIVVDRARLFLPIKKLMPLQGSYSLNNERGKWQHWLIEKGCQKGDFQETTGWEAAWKGRLEFYIPKGNFFLQSYEDLPSNAKKNLQRLWSNAKIPAFFRKIVPVLTDGDCLIREFLLSSKKSTMTVVDNIDKVILYLE